MPLKLYCDRVGGTVLEIEALDRVVKETLLL